MYSLTNSNIQPLDDHHINATNCENLIYSQNLIFLTCPQVIVYEIATSKRFDLPETDIYPEDIVVSKDELDRLHVVLVGDAHMAYYHDLRRQPLYGALYTHIRVVAGERNRFVGISNYIIAEFEISPKF
jgi:hypothetical protein